jgi:glycosyltransferase involved in cell wall biosynthesis
MSCEVSVIIPTYNRLGYLREALDSVLRQTAPPREILIIDDGSTDGTAEWLEGQDFPALRMLRQENRGPAAARNLGLAAATGRHVAFLDSDDLWLPEKLNIQTDFLQGNPEYKFCQTEEVWIRRGLRVQPMKKHAKPTGWVFESCLPLCLISPSALMIEREFLLDLGGFDIRFPVCEDYELWLRATLRSPIRTLPQALTVKRGGHPDQLSRRYWGMDRFRVMALEKILATEQLNEAQRNSAQRELARKLRILSKGFAKRHPNGHDPYEEKLRCLSQGSD